MFEKQKFPGSGPWIGCSFHNPRVSSIDRSDNYFDAKPNNSAIKFKSICNLSAS